MAAPKKPADHKPKVEKVEVHVPVLKGGRPALDEDGKQVTRAVPARRVVIRGIQVTVADEALDDFELLDDLSQLEENKAARLPSVARRLFGEGYRKILDELRGPNGRVSINDANTFIGDVFGALNPN